VCYGCGVRVQLVSPDAPGYVAPDKYAPKAAHRQLDQLLCGRCGSLAHGRLVNAVAGQGSALAVPPAAAGLITPEALRAHLTALKRRKVLVVLLVDALDFSGSFLPRLRDAVGANPVLLVVTKADLLPSSADERALGDWIEAEVGHRRLSLVGLHLVSAKKGDGIKGAVAAMSSLRAGRDVVVVGAANVGKSSFIRAALAAMRAGGDVAAPGRRLPLASPMPGTTLGVIPLRAFRGEGVLYDTPGVVLHHRINGMLDGIELAALAQRGPVRPREAACLSPDGLSLVAPEPVGSAFFWEGLARVDVLEAPPGSRLLFWGPEAARVGAVSIEEADAGRTPWDGDDAAGEDGDADGQDGAVEGEEGEAAPPAGSRRGPRAVLGAAAVAARGGLRVAREVELEAGSRLAPIADVAISGLGGWVTLVAGGSGRGGVGVARCVLRVWAPRGAEVFVRPPMPVFPHGSW
jgi:nitric-oxide synthase